MIELCREGAAESEGNNGGLADQRGSHLNSERSNRNDEAPADLVEAAPAPAPRSLQTITFPPELLPIADEPAEVIVKCVCGLDWSPSQFEQCPVCALVTVDQIRFGLALANDLRRINKRECEPGGYIVLNTDVQSVIRAEARIRSQKKEG